MAIYAIQELVAPETPAKPVAKLTPALKARIAKMRKDVSRKVAARAQRFVSEVA